MKDLTNFDREALVRYIEELETKVETLTAQLDVLNLDMEEFSVPETAVPELNLSEQTSDALAEAAALFGGETELPKEPETIVEPAPVENGVVRLDPVTAEEYIPVAPAKKTVVKVKVKRK